MCSPKKSVLAGNSLAITTSWDDGHPLDFRIAELLAKYGLPGTFYVPLHNSRPTLSPVQIRELATSFEIGAHTVSHVRLTTLKDEDARREIEDSKKQLEDILGKPCLVFCFPGGRYKSVHLPMLRTAGFSGVRTVELLSLQRPFLTDGFSLIPTTIQAFPHRRSTYLRNVLKRGRLDAMRNWVPGIRLENWPDIARLLLQRAVRTGGVFHLWGHSWEIEETGQWGALKQFLALLSEYKVHATLVTNAELCTGQ